MLQLAIILLLILILIYFFGQKEKFIDYTAQYSYYGPQPIAILTKYMEKKMDYYELEQKTKHLIVMEIFRDSRYKLYSDDSLVREGYLKKNEQNIINQIMKVADKYDGKVYCPSGIDFTKYKLWLNGRNVYLGLFGEDCTPAELKPVKQLFKLMEFSDISL